MVGDILQPTHLIFILVVALLVLGPKRLPEVGRSLGRGIRDFRGALSGADEPSSSSTDGDSYSEPEVPPVTPATTSMPGAVSAAPDEESPATVAVPFGNAADEEGSSPAVGSSPPRTVEGSAVEHEETETAETSGSTTAAPEPHPVAPAGDRPSSQA